ncbi:LysR family transcriptional regulator [Cytobacillus sp. FJAT-54145]|uniref:LysR family transcriptional regulator n=1 Tax=Cytobacillus spartinae TaxID=3299023 RepID=A0ABW6KG49_9BACI
MNLNALRVFYTVVEAGGVTKAAEKLSLTQPAITAQIRNLENEIDVKLFFQKGRTLELTLEGKELFSYSKRLFKTEQEMEEHLNDLKMGNVGTLRIVATHYPSVTVALNWLGKFKKLYPNVKTEMIRRNSKSALKEILNGTVDVGIIAGEWGEEGIEKMELIQDRLIFICPCNHPLAGNIVKLNELMRESFVYREKGSSTRVRLISLCEERGMSAPPMAMEIEGMLEGVVAVKQGIGVMLAPELAVEAILQEQDYGRIFVEDLSEMDRTIYLCKRANEPLQSNSKHFADIVFSSIEIGVK